MSDLSGPHTPELAGLVKQARRSAWLSIAYVLSCVALLALVMSGSQALLTEIVEDGLSLIAPVLFLVGDRISARPASKLYPFGYERATSAAYLGAALALLAAGMLVFGDSALKLIETEHPSIGGFDMGGQVIWIGWLAIPVLLWCAIPSWLLGRSKKKLAESLNDKGLLADAQTKTANWQSAGAAIVGILGVAAGLWWADAVAALFISLEIVRSGWSEVRTALADLMDRRPQKLGRSDLDPLPEKLTQFLRREDWIADAVVRVREKGRELIAEGMVVPRHPMIDVTTIDGTAKRAKELDDRLEHVALVPTARLDEHMQSLRLL
ncbi:MAG: cation diffusion facilitator family transporter [Alphaproteobacteria bacterium]|nr:cation diffusion facilitator family transporter [Alphaproteobacteria bacterium]